MIIPAMIATNKAGPHIDQGDLPAEEAPEKHDRNLVHHRRGNEEGECYAERNACFDEPDKERDRRTGAERRDDAEEGGENITDKLPFMGQNAFGPLRGEIGSG